MKMGTSFTNINHKTLAEPQWNVQYLPITMKWLKTLLYIVVKQWPAFWITSLTPLKRKGCYTSIWGNKIALRWRHNERDSVSNNQPHDGLLNRLYRRRLKKSSKLRVTGLCLENAPGPVNSPHKWPVTRKVFPLDDVIIDIDRIFVWSVIHAAVKYISC